MTDLNDLQGAAAWLRTPQAIRLRCNALYRAAESGTLSHFDVDPDRIGAVADYVVETIRANYPDLAIPYHARWRHFAIAGRDRWAELRGRLAGVPQDEIARIQIDLVVTSVLRDAGAGPTWRPTWRSSWAWRSKCTP